MTKQKQSRLDLVENKVKAMISVLQKILEESAHVKELSVGTLQLIKMMPDYDKALEDLTVSLKKEEEANEPEKKLEL
jgi:hypothetical protein